MARVQVDIKSPEDFEKMAKLFKRLCQKDGFIQEIRERRYFLTKAEKKKLKREKNRKNKHKR